MLHNFLLAAVSTNYPAKVRQAIQSIDDNLKMLQQISLKQVVNGKDGTSDIKETVLMKAVELGNLDIVKTLIEAGADVTSSTEKGTALHYACTKGNIDIVKTLIDTYKRQNAATEKKSEQKNQNASETALAHFLDARDPEGLTPLIAASIQPHPAIVELLLNEGANACLASEQGGTALNILTNGTIVEKNPKERLETIKILLRNPDRASFLLLYRAGKMSHTALQQLTFPENLDMEIAETLIYSMKQLKSSEAKENLDTVYKEAVRFPCYFLLQAFLKHGYSPSLQDLHNTVNGGGYSYITHTFKFLFAKFPASSVPLLFDSQRDFYNQSLSLGKETLLMTAAIKAFNRREIVDFLLQSNDVNYQNDKGYTAIFFAIAAESKYPTFQNDQVYIVKALINAGADLTHKSKEGESIIDFLFKDFSNSAFNSLIPVVSFEQLDQILYQLSKFTPNEKDLQNNIKILLKAGAGFSKNVSDIDDKEIKNAFKQRKQTLNSVSESLKKAATQKETILKTISELMEDLADVETKKTTSTKTKIKYFSGVDSQPLLSDSTEVKSTNLSNPKLIGAKNIFTQWFDLLFNDLMSPKNLSNLATRLTIFEQVMQCLSSRDYVRGADYVRAGKDLLKNDVEYQKILNAFLKLPQPIYQNQFCDFLKQEINELNRFESRSKFFLGMLIDLARGKWNISVSKKTNHVSSPIAVTQTLAQISSSNNNGEETNSNQNNLKKQNVTTPTANANASTEHRMN